MRRFAFILYTVLAVLPKVIAFPVDESTRSLAITSNWRQVEMPGHLDVRSLDAVSGSELWIGALDAAVHYDGVQWTEYPLPAGDPGRPVYAIRKTTRGEVFILTPIGFFQLEKDEWVKRAFVWSRRFPSGQIIEGKSGNIWVGHDNGIGCLSLDGEFHNVTTARNVAAMCEDAAGYLWWAEGRSRVVYRAPADPERLADRGTWELMMAADEDHIIPFSSMSTDQLGRVWLATIEQQDVVRYFDPGDKEWHAVDISAKTGSNLAFGVVPDEAAGVWIFGSGFLLNTDGKDTAILQFPDVAVPQTRSLMEISSDGVLWIAEIGGRPLRASLNGVPWQRFEGLHFQCDALGLRWYLDEDGAIWTESAEERRPRLHPLQAGEMVEHPVRLVPTRAGGVMSFGADGNAAAFAIFNGESWTRHRFPEFASGFEFGAFCELADGRLAFGSGQQWNRADQQTGGMLIVRLDGDEIEQEIYPGRDPIPFRVESLVEVVNGDLFLGGSRLIQFQGGEPQNITAETGRMRVRTNSLLTDHDGRLWGAVYSLGVFRQAENGFEWFYPDSSGLSEMGVLDLLVLPEGDILALTGTAVFRFDGKRWSKSIELPRAFPLPNGGAVMRLDGEGALWINIAHNFWRSRWTQDSGYSADSRPDFGSLRYRFDRDPPETTLRSIQQRVTDVGFLEAEIGGWDNLGRTQRDELQFSHRIDGGAWSPFSLSHTIIMDSAGEGVHLIEARARDRDFNIDPTFATLTFEVVVPFWRETGFYQFLGLLVGLSLIAYIVTVRYRARHLLNLEKQKLTFFTNLSHEIRTPLALVIAPLERVSRMAADTPLSRYIQQALIGSAELKRIIDQLLDFRRSQSGLMQPRHERADLVVFAQTLLDSFNLVAADKRQKLELVTELATLSCRTDVERLTSVLNNLLMNSLRYSPEGACIRLVLRLSGAGKRVMVAVEDEGIGMDPRFVSKALMPFERGKDERVRGVKGTGIGLAFVNELVKGWGGELEITSPLRPGSRDYPGTRVAVTFPIETVEEDEPESESATAPQPMDGDESSLLLLVEDDQRNGEFLRDELQKLYRVVWARDGEEALALATAEIPDIILTDRMMPKVDGIEFCRRIRADLATQHIPIIMLTAAASRRFELEAFEAGANGFVGKPYSLDALEGRLANQLQISRGMRDCLLAELQSEAQAIVGAEKIRDPFLEKICDLVDDKLGDFEFTAIDLAGQLFMSRSAFYRKLKAVANLSPSEFVRSRRMRRAGQLVINTQMPVAEIMEAVGVIDHRTFSKWFKACFGCTPTEMRTNKSKREPFPSSS